MNLTNKISFQISVLGKLFYRHSKIVLLLVILLTVSILLFDFFIAKNRLFSNNQISEGIVGTYTEDNLPKAITSLLSRPLIKIDQKGLPQGDLVDNWEVNKEATRYIFQLRKDQRWLDGSLIKAPDINISIQDATIKILDDQRIEFDLADSFSPLPTLLISPVLKKNSLMGSGPYRIDRIDKDQIFIRKIVLKSNKESRPDITIRFYPNEKIAKNALRIGEVQSLLGINETNDLTKDKPFKILSKVNYTRLVTIFFNTQDPFLSDRNYRLALAFAAPSIKSETEAKTSIPPTSWAFNSDVKDFLDNPELAKQYFAKVKQGKDIPLILTVTAPLKDVGQQVVQSWEKQGIKAVMRVESGIPQNFQALLIAQEIPVDPDQYSLWHSTQTKTNVSQYFSSNQYSPRVDKDLEDGRKTTNLEVRKQRYLDLQKVLLDDAPAVPLFFSRLNVVYVQKIEEPLKKVTELQLNGLQVN